MLLKITLVFAFSFFTLAVIHFIKKHFSRAYFSLGEIIVSEKDVVTAGGLCTKFLPPLVFGFLLSIIIRENTISFVVLYGFLASFLAVWPPILCPAEVLSREARKKRNSLYFIYFLYVALYVTLSVLGYNVYLLLSDAGTMGAFDFLKHFEKLSSFAEKLIISIISTIVAMILMKLYGVTMRRLRTRLRVNADHDTEGDTGMVR